MTQHTVSGATSAPLHHESALSVLLRIASSNALTQRQTLGLFLQHPPSGCELDLFRIGTRRAQGWGSRIGWHWQPLEGELMSVLPGLKSVMWSARSRWCPVCISFGFHSVWFQLSALAACPIHECPLTECCEVCAEALGPYKVSRALFLKPYHCAACGNPFAGHLRSLRERLEFFRCNEEISQAFGPLARWYSQATRELLFLDISNRGLRDTDALRFRDRILEGAIRQFVPHPRMYAMTDSFPVRLRSWSIRMAHDSPAGELPSRYGLLSGGAARSAYQATTRSLTSLVTQHPPGHRRTKRLAFDKNGVAALDGWHPARLALVILRCIFEEPFFLICDAPIRGAVLRSSIFGAAIVESRLLRVACRALVLATFLAAHELASSYVARGFICRQDLMMSSGDLVVLVGNVSNGIQDGVVAFPDTSLTDRVVGSAWNPDALGSTVRRLNAAFSERIAS
jgi:hypothetical protein